MWVLASWAAFLFEAFDWNGGGLGYLQPCRINQEIDMGAESQLRLFLSDICVDSVFFLTVGWVTGR